MRQLNGTYTQTFNRRYHECGHLFQGRYKAILVEKETYLLELTRYVVLNPVRAKMVRCPEHWKWSNYNATISTDVEPGWLDVDWTLSQFGQSRTKAITAYKKFVMEGKGLPDPKEKVKHQMFLGNDEFITEYQQAEEKPEKLREVSKAHKRAIALSLTDYQNRYEQRNEAMARAYLSGAYTMIEIGLHFNVHYMTVSRAVKKYEK